MEFSFVRRRIDLLNDVNWFMGKKRNEIDELIVNLVKPNLTYGLFYINTGTTCMGATIFNILSLWTMV